MSLSISLNVPDQQLEENVTCHIVPCKIGHTGKCNVGKYFEPYIRDNDGILTCSLRGHPLQGQNVTVPDGYKGVVLKDNKKLLSSEEKRELKAMGSFKKFTFWNWDKTPSAEDNIVKALQWIDVASALHKPVSEYEEHETEKFKTGIKRKQPDSES